MNQSVRIQGPSLQKAFRFSENLQLGSWANWSYLSDDQAGFAIIVTGFMPSVEA